MKYFLITLLILAIFGSTAPPVSAVNLCLEVKGQQRCILRIKRSAKNYWEYRAKIDIDGKQKAKEIYNCRDRTVKRTGKVAIPFKPNSLGELVCDFFS